METVNLNPYLIKHLHGITRTLADLVIMRNNVELFHSSKEVLKYLETFYERLRQNEGIHYIMSYRTLQIILKDPNIFENGNLNHELLYNRLLSVDLFTSDLTVAYDLCCREKLYNLIVFFNAYRHYQSWIDIFNDLKTCGIVSINNLEDIKIVPPLKHKRMFPELIFEKFWEQRWNEVVSNGVLDVRKLNELMFENYEKDLDELGLNEVINTNYVLFSECHADVLYPKQIGYGPIYVRIGDGMYSRACDQGLFRYNHLYEDSVFLFERELLFKVLDCDKKYVHIGSYYIPRINWRLPVFDEYHGEIKFSNPFSKVLKILFTMITRGSFKVMK